MYNTKVFSLGTSKMTCKIYIFLQCIWDPELGVNFRNSYGNIYFFSKHNVKKLFLMNVSD